MRGYIATSKITDLRLSWERFEDGSNSEAEFQTSTSDKSSL